MRGNELGVTSSLAALHGPIRVDGACTSHVTHNHLLPLHAQMAELQRDAEERERQIELDFASIPDSEDEDGEE